MRGLQRSRRRASASARLNPEQREALKQVVETGLNPAVDGVVRWRLCDLAQWVHAEFGISISKQTLSRMLRAMAPAYAGVSARPRRHAQDPAAPLAEIARAVTPGARAALLLDQAGWHLSDKLAVPGNITLLLLPPRCPELNPVENLR